MSKGIFEVEKRVLYQEKRSKTFTVIDDMFSIILTSFFVTIGIGLGLFVLLALSFSIGG